MPQRDLQKIRFEEGPTESCHEGTQWWRREWPWMVPHTCTYNSPHPTAPKADCQGHNSKSWARAGHCPYARYTDTSKCIHSLSQVLLPFLFPLLPRTPGPSIDSGSRGQRGLGISVNNNTAYHRIKVIIKMDFLIVQKHVALPSDAMWDTGWVQELRHNAIGPLRAHCPQDRDNTEKEWINTNQRNYRELREFKQNVYKRMD